MKLDPFMRPDHEKAREKQDLIRAGIHNVEKFLIELGIRVNKIETQMYEIRTMHYNREYSYSFEFLCSCPEPEYKHFKSFSRLINVTRYPRVRPLKAIIPQDPLDTPVSMYEFDEIVDFKFQADIRELEDVDDFARRIMEATKPLQYKRFCEDFDEQVEDELGE